MPKTSAAASEVLPFALSGHPLPAPDYLTDEQRRFWHDLVNPFPPEKFGPDVQPVLVELVRHMAISAKLNEEIGGMRRARLTGASPERAKLRRAYCQLVAAHAAESHLIAMLSVKLRLVDQSKSRKVLADAERERTPTGPRPWDTIAGQH